MPAEVRASAAPAIQAHLAFQDRQITLLQEQIASMQAELGKIRLQLADVQARAQQHSGNSSRPPSTDPPDVPPRPQRPSSERKRGGQPGHAGHARLALAADKIAAVVEHRPGPCPSCTLRLYPTWPTEGDPVGRQAWEIPPLVPQVTEHRSLSVRCPHCDVLEPAADLRDGALGPRLTAIGSLPHGRYRLRMRETAHVLGDLFGVPLPVGSVPARCQKVSAALQEPDAAVRAFCADVLTLERALWRFAQVNGVEPTNNEAERALRPIVTGRKESGVTRSAQGSLDAMRRALLFRTWHACRLNPFTRVRKLLLSPQV